MSKHTPGPWKSPAYNPWNIIAPKESNGGGGLYHVASVKTSSNGIANARLIAAAPEMLEALKAARYAIDALRRKIPAGKLTKVTADIDAQCKAAIAKATGS